MKKNKNIIRIIIIIIILFNNILSSANIDSLSENNEQTVEAEKIENNLLNDEVIKTKNFDNHEIEPNYQKEENLKNETEKYFYIELEKEDNKEVLIVIKKDNKKEIEYYSTIENEIEIKKEEEKINENELQVIVFSEKHYEKEVKVYAGLPKETKNKEDITILWENENKKINKEEIEFYDYNNNGLFDRVSWIIPHLSEQRFKIIISPITDTKEENLTIEIKKPLNNETITHPLVFEFTINYTNLSNVECNLTIENTTFSLNPNNQLILLDEPLKEGVNNWLFFCKDKINPSIESSKTGNFIVPKLGIITKKVHLIGKNFKINFTGVKENEEINLTLIKPDNTKKTYKIIHDNQEKEISSDEITNLGNYMLNVSFINRSSPYTITETFQTLFVDLKANNKTVDIEKKVEFRLNISSSTNLNRIKFHFGDGNSNTSEILPLGTKIFIRNYSYQYPSIGEFTPIIEIDTPEEKVNFSWERITTYSSKDSEKPVVRLISPEDGITIEESIIDFIYKVTDNDKINNCTLKIYNATRNEEAGDIGKLTFPLNEEQTRIATVNNPKNNSEIKITLQKFLPREYLWSVDCFDASGNKNIPVSNYFIVKEKKIDETFLGQEKNEKTDYIKNEIERINLFMEKEKEKGADEKRIIEILGIINELKTIKNRLIQINNEINFAINNIKDPVQKENKIKNLNEEIDNLKKKIPNDLTILEKEEQVKNTRPENIEKIIEEYLKIKNIRLGKNALKSLISYNKNLQNQIIIKSALTKFRIDYNEENKILILVEKDIKITSEEKNLKIIEFFPKEINLEKKDYEFKTEINEILEGRFFERKKEENELKINYLIKKDFDLEKVSQAETLLFSDNLKNNNFLTGFVSFDFSIPESDLLTKEKLKDYLYLLLVPIILLGSYFLLRKKIIKKNIEEMLLEELINDAKRKIKAGDLELAKQNYKQIQKAYNSLRNKTRKLFYPEIKKVYSAIIKKEIVELLKEYEEATKKMDREKAEISFRKINEIYKKIDEETKERLQKKVEFISLIKK